jgi:hypothetical protein
MLIQEYSAYKIWESDLRENELQLRSYVDRSRKITRSGLLNSWVSVMTNLVRLLG